MSTAQVSEALAAPGSDEVDRKLDALRARLRGLGSVLVCYSGGIDSAFVLALGHEVLGARAIGMTAVSPSLAPAEKDEAVALAREIGAEHRLVESHEIDDPDYAKNAADRCFHCKSELYRIAGDRRRAWGLAAVLNGTNLDDLGDYRPGLRAAEEAGALAPLVECGFRKADVREAARRMGLRLWDKPAAACLSSRIPYGTSVTRERLEQIARLEAELRGLGFRQVRVRHHGEIARLELELEELPRAAAPGVRERLVAAGKACGFHFVALDLAGYRQGSHNELLSRRSLPVLG